VAVRDSASCSSYVLLEKPAAVTGRRLPPQRLPWPQGYKGGLLSPMGAASKPPGDPVYFRDACALCRLCSPSFTSRALRAACLRVLGVSIATALDLSGNFTVCRRSASCCAHGGCLWIVLPAEAPLRPRRGQSPRCHRPAWLIDASLAPGCLFVPPSRNLLDWASRKSPRRRPMASVAPGRRPAG